MNVSLNEIENEEFVDNAIEILLKSNIESKRICLEITERVKMENLDNLKKSIKRLKDDNKMDGYMQEALKLAEK